MMQSIEFFRTAEVTRAVRLTGQMLTERTVRVTIGVEPAASRPLMTSIYPTREIYSRPANRYYLDAGWLVVKLPLTGFSADGRVSTGYLATTP
jgi:hypothetical protein